MASKGPSAPGIGQALRACRGAWIGAAIASGFVNLLMLTGAIFMLQVYDRVLPSRSIPTLVGLCIFALCLYAFQAVFDILRARLLARGARQFDDILSGPTFDAAVQSGLRRIGHAEGPEAVRSLETLRGFMSGMGLGAFFDLPWLPVYVAVCFMFHPWIGALVLAGTLLIGALTLWADVLTRPSLRQVATVGNTRRECANEAHRSAEIATALGMVGQMRERWARSTDEYLTQTQAAGDLAGTFGSLSRVIRMILQSTVLATGALLVIEQQATAGLMLAATIVASRALAPVDMVVANWQPFMAARQAWQRLSEILASMDGKAAVTPLPDPSRELAVNALSAAPPGQGELVLHGLNFTLKAGQALGVIGASGSGKSSLARALAGVWRPLRGRIRLDGADYGQWEPDALGRHIGYLPQDVDLMSGTVAEVISRFDPSANPEKLFAAARAAGVHDLIVKLPKGFDTPVGAGGMALSGGQRQRLGLARALYRNPFLVILDEPNSSLDIAGEAALTAALLGVRQRGGIVVIIAHRASALAAVDQLLVLNGGLIEHIGPRDDVLARLTSKAANAVAIPAPVVARKPPEPAAIKANGHNPPAVKREGKIGKSIKAEATSVAKTTRQKAKTHVAH